MRITNLSIKKGKLVVIRESVRCKDSSKNIVEIELDKEIITWLTCRENLRYIKLISNKLSNRLANPRARKALIYLLYSEVHNIKPYKLALPRVPNKEQLYRHRRALKSEGIYDAALHLLSKC